jgi:hypothetical protein
LINGYYGPISSISDTVQIQLVRKPLSLSLKNISPRIDLTKETLTFDASDSTVGANYPSPDDLQITYTLDCPFYLFASDQKRASVCNPNQQTGYL